MRILFVTNFITEYRKPLFELMARRWDVRFLFYSDGGEWYWNGPVMDIGDLPGRYLPGFWMGRTRVTPGLIAELSREPYDLIISGGTGKLSLPTSFAAAKLRRRPFILWTGIWRQPDGIVHRLGRPLLAKIYDGADAIVTYGNHVTEHLVEQGVDRRKLFVAAQSVDPDRFPYSWDPIKPNTIRSVAGLEIRGPMVAFVGRLEPSKGPQLLVHTIARLRATGTDVNGLIVGEGRMRSDLERISRDLGIQGRIVFVGSVPNAELCNVYRSASACVIPSVITRSFAEPWSLVANEAMLAGCPVIASNAVGAVRDGLIQHRETGLVFGEGDADGLANAIRTVLDHPEQRRISRAASERVAGYTYEAAVQGFERAIEFAVSGQREV